MNKGPTTIVVGPLFIEYTFLGFSGPAIARARGGGMGQSEVGKEIEGLGKDILRAHWRMCHGHGHGMAMAMAMAMAMDWKST